ncbi:TAXI family TRAP transporter solute-binding subunit [Streptomyces sp. B1866]|uniref:TAXI family TRAP transporter solute-binding subunit n=1 Tax=Streptomyces sp. B1866 TaxID=3075431 RepID=UPI00288D8CD2|nr:TAXI family TRAP transporter solute-binding subunit [Streptomyces sp. B1866]MDT3398545.1 TAXI family TRAP transporter solute-binding subunit [Streptomyces sp. B1866]
MSASSSDRSPAPGGRPGRRPPVGSLPRGRRALLAAVAAAAALALLLWWLLPFGGRTESPRRVVFSTGVRQGVYDRYGGLLKEYLRRDAPELDVELLGSRGSVENVRRVAEGKAAFAIAATDSVAAYHGPGARRLRACARLYDDYLQLVVPKGSPVRSVRDLRGLRVGVGQTASGVRLITGQLTGAAGLAWDRDFTPVGVGIDRMPDMLESGELKAFFWSGGLPTTIVRSLADRFPIRLVPLGDLLGPLHRQGPQARYYRAATVPADVYPPIAQTREVSTIAVPNLLVTTDRMDPGLVETVTRTVIRSRDAIGRQVHAAQNVDLRTAVFTDPLELHAGAARYYRSAKP